MQTHKPLFGPPPPAGGGGNTGGAPPPPAAPVESIQGMLGRPPGRGPPSILTYAECANLYTDPTISSFSSSLSSSCLLDAELAHVQRERAARRSRPVPPFEAANLSFVEPVAHTSAYALPSYCLSKVPVEHLHRAVQRDEPFCVWGMLDAHVVEYCWQRGHVARHVPTASKPKSDALLNRDRPQLFFVQPAAGLALALQKGGGLPAALEAVPGFFVLAVFGGSDYAHHFARMVIQTMEAMKRGACALVELRRFTALENDLPRVTRMDCLDVSSGDVVVLGHVRDYRERLLQLDATWLSCDPARGAAQGSPDQEVHFDAARLAACAHVLREQRRQQQQQQQQQRARGGATSGAAAAPDEPLPPLRAWWSLFAPAPASGGGGGGGGEAGAAFEPPLHAECCAEVVRTEALRRGNDSFSVDVAARVVAEKDAPLLVLLLKTQHAKLVQALPYLLGRAAGATAAEFAFTPDTLPWCAWVTEALTVAHGGLCVPPAPGAPPVRRVFFLGLRLSYWGNTCLHIARWLYEKTPFVIYAAKCGTLASPGDIHKVVFPHRYCVLLEPSDAREAVAKEVAPPRNFTFVSRRGPLDPQWLDLQWLDPLWREGREAGGSGGPLRAPSPPEVAPPPPRFFSLGLPPDSGRRRTRRRVLHFSVPTIVGETYAARRVMEEAARAHADRAVLIARLRLFGERYLDESRKKELLAAAETFGVSSSSDHEVLMKLIPLLRPPYCGQPFVAAEGGAGTTRPVTEADVVAEVLRRDGGATAHPADTLASIDNETSWFARAARERAGKLGYFSCFHRTTDYVRRVEDRCAITADDLAAERGRGEQRAKVIVTVGGMLYKVLRSFCAFSGAPPGEEEALRKCNAVTQLRWGMLGASHISHKFVAAVRASSWSKFVAIAKERGSDEGWGDAYFARHGAEVQKAAARAGERAGAAREAAAATAATAATASEAAAAETLAAAAAKAADVAAREASPGAPREAAAHASYDDLLRNSEVNAVYVSMANDAHAQWAIAAAHAGKHVLVEKPVALLAADVDCVLAAARERGVLVAEAMLPCHHPLLDRVRALCASLGGAREARMRYTHGIPRGGIAWRSVSAGGGALAALGCYPIAVALALFGPLAPSEARAVPATEWPQQGEADGGEGAPSGEPPDESFTARLTRGDGGGGGGGAPPFAVEFCVSIGEGPSHQDLEVTCERGTIRVPAPFRPGTDGTAAPAIFVQRLGQAEEEERVLCVGGAFSVQLAAFERAMLLGEELAYPLERSKDAVALANELRDFAARPAAL
jgi:predicted dehydrogenase